MGEGSQNPEGADYNVYLRRGQKRTDSGRMPRPDVPPQPTYKEAMPHVHPDQGPEGTGPRFRRSVKGQDVRQPTVQQATLGFEKKPFEDQIMSSNSNQRQLKKPTPIERQILRADRGETNREDDQMASKQRWAIKRSIDRRKGDG